VILDNGNPNVILCERGIRTFETATAQHLRRGRIALLKQISHLPVIADPSHAAGIATWFRAGAHRIAAGADGLLVEVHPNPDKAWSDGDQSLDFAAVRRAMMADLEPWLALRAVVGTSRREGIRSRGVALIHGGSVG
jgi:3-deoxy-7-phosphoheptulonate synthase